MCILDLIKEGCYHACCMNLAGKFGLGVSSSEKLFLLEQTISERLRVTQTVV